MPKNGPWVPHSTSVRDPGREFARRRRKVYIMEAAIMVILLLRILVLKRFIDLPAGAWILLAAALISAGVWYGHRIWRCPNCGANPGYDPHPEKCGQCGVELGG